MNLQVVGMNLLFLGIGLISWYLALLRTLVCVRGQRLSVVGLVFAEELLSIATIYLLVADKNIYGALFYAVGGAIGAYFATAKREIKSEQPSQ